MITMVTSFYSTLQKSIRFHKQFSELQKIMQHNLLTTYFQPILNLQDGCTLGYEILNRPPQSEQFPSTESFYEFIGHTDHVFAFEHFCRERSIERFRISLAREGKPAKDTVIFLNIHPQVLSDSSYRSGETISLLYRNGISPEQVVFEHIRVSIIL